MADRQPTFGIIYSRLHEQAPPPIFGQLVEGTGFDAVWVTEGLANQKPALDPIVSMTALAGATSTVTVGSCVLLVPLRHPVLLAKEVASLDVVSGGRIVLGIGVGGDSMSNPADYRACGISPRKRGQRCDESIVVMKALWQGQKVTHAGAFFNFDEISVQPVPVQTPHPPIWAGGNATGVFRRTARFCDGFVPMGNGPDQYTADWREVCRFCEEYDRDPDEITRAVHLYYCMDRNRNRAHRIVERTLTERYGFDVSLPDENQFLYGTPDDCARTIERYQQAGVQHFVINTARPVQEVTADITRFAESVAPKFK